MNDDRAEAVERSHAGDERGHAGGKDPFWTAGRVKAVVAIVAVVAVGSLMATSRGCRPPSSTARGTVQDPEKEAKQRDQRFDAAWDGLQRPEEFDGMFGADEQLGQDMDRLNQWLEAQKPLAEWRVDQLAAPLVQSLAGFAQYVKPVAAALAGPRDALELKDIARHFTVPVARLEALAQRRSLAELDALAVRYDRTVKQIEDIARKTSDSLRESRESDRDPAAVGPKAGGGSGGDEAQLSVYETRFLDQFSRRIGNNPAKQATFKELFAIARQLNYPGRLRDPASLAALVQAMEDFSAKHSRKEAEDLVKQYEDVVSRYEETLRKTRLSEQLRFVLDELGNVTQMKDLAEWKALDQVIAEAAERLRIAAKRTGNAELGELAIRIDNARSKRDYAALKTAAAQVVDLVRPEASDDLRGAAGQLAERAKLLVRLAEEAGRLGQERQSPGLESLAKYATVLAANVKAAATRLEGMERNTGKMPADAGKMPELLDAGKMPTDPGKMPVLLTSLDQFTIQYAVLAARVGRLAEDLDYFATLGTLRFPAEDWDSVREAILLRDVSRWARGEEADDLSRAKHLFDWTVRNIQLAPDGADPFVPGRMKRPWETLVLGSGTAMERAWVFILLARQQGLDAAMLALEEVGEKAAASAGGTPAPQRRLRPWAVAVLSGKDLYLFDPYLGLPLRGPGGVKLDESGQLDVQPATLGQVVADPGLLRQMDVDATRPYWVQASHLKRVAALLEASPAYLAERMRVTESRLAGEDGVVLAAAGQRAPSAQAERIKACRGIAEVGLWPLPYETWLRRMQGGDEGVLQYGAALGRIASGALWKGRVRHLQHRFTGESNAAQFYGKARPLEREIETAAPTSELKVIARLAKQNAGYWLGLMAFEQGRSDPRKYVMAADYVGNGTLDAYPGGAWTAGAKYNFGRICEARKAYAEAIKHYGGNAGSAQAYGDQLRARWLAKLTGAEPPVLPDLPGLPVEKEPAKKGAASKEEPQPKQKAATPPSLPGLPGLPVENEPANKPASTKKEPSAKEPSKPPSPTKGKTEPPALPALPGLE